MSLPIVFEEEFARTIQPLVGFLFFFSSGLEILCLRAGSSRQKQLFEMGFRLYELETCLC